MGGALISTVLVSEDRCENPDLSVSLRLFRSWLQHSLRRRVLHSNPVLLEPVQQQEEEGPRGRCAGEQTATGPPCWFLPHVPASGQGTEVFPHVSLHSVRLELSLISTMLSPSSVCCDMFWNKHGTKQACCSVMLRVVESQRVELVPRDELGWFPAGEPRPRRLGCGKSRARELRCHGDQSDRAGFSSSRSRLHAHLVC